MGVRKLVEALKNSISEKIAWQWQFKAYPEETHFSTAMPALYDALTFLAPTFTLIHKICSNLPATKRY